MYGTTEKDNPCHTRTFRQRSVWILGYKSPPIEYPVNVTVKWDMCAWMWETLGDKKYYLSFPDAWCHYECEVIGTVFNEEAGN